MDSQRFQFVPNRRQVLIRRLVVILVLLLGSLLVLQSRPALAEQWYPDWNKYPDHDDDSVSPLGKNDDGNYTGCGMPESGGPAMHVTYATGNVWTQVPILTMYAEDEVSLEIMLTYNSLFIHTDSGLGAGWSLGYRMRGGGGSQTGAPPVPTSYFIQPEQAGNQTQCQDSCTPGGTDCSVHQDGVYDGHTETQCGDVHILYKPGSVVIVDSDGRNNPYYWYQAGYGAPGPAPYTDCHFYNLGLLYPPTARTANLVDLQDTSPPYRFRLDALDGTKYFFKSIGTTNCSSGHGVLAKVVPPRQTTTNLSYDESGHCTQITDAFSRVVNLTWDGPGGRLHTIVSTAQGGSTTLLYDAFGRLASITDPLGKSTSFGYDNFETVGRMTLETLKNDHQFICSYADWNSDFTSQSPEGTGDVRGRTIFAENPQTGTLDRLLTVASGMFLPSRAPAYNNLPWSDGVTVINGNGQQWHYARDVYGRMTQRYDDSQTYFAQVTYNTYETGQLDPSNWRRLQKFELLSPPYLRKDFAWQNGDGLNGRFHAGRLAQTTVNLYDGSPLQTNLSFSTDPNAPFPELLLHRVEPNMQGAGVDWSYGYNDHGDCIRITDPYEHSTLYSYTYFSDGRLDTVTETNRRGFQTIREYSGTGNLVDKSVQIGGTQFIQTTYEYDGLGRMTKETTDRGDQLIATQYSYDPLGRLLTTVENYIDGGPKDNVTNLTTVSEYDGHGLLTKTINPRGFQTKYEYDHRNWLIKKTEDCGTQPDNLNLLTQYVRDGNGNIGELIEPDTTRHSYFHYDIADNLIWMQDAEGYISSMRRNGVGKVIEYHRQRTHQDNADDPYGDGYSDTTAYTASYDAYGRVLGYSLSDAYPFQRTFEYGNWAANGCGCSGLGTTYPHKSTSTAVGEPRTTFCKVDYLGRLTRVLKKISGASENPATGDAKTDYFYDEEGNRIEILGPAGEDSILEYDGANRLKKRTVHGAPGPDSVTQYTSDGFGNIQTVTLPSGETLTYHYDGGNRMQQVMDGSQTLATYSHDQNGNRLSQADGLGNTWTSIFDHVDRPIQVHDPIIEAGGDKFTENQYDAAGNLTQTQLNGVITCRTYDKLNRLLCVSEDCDPSVICSGGSGQSVDGSSQGGNQGVDTLGGGGSVSSTGTQNNCTCCTYDGRFLISQTDGDNDSTYYYYDIAGRISGIFYLQPACEYFDMGDPCTGYDRVMYTYGDADWNYPTNTVVRTDQLGASTTLTFDNLGMVARRDYSTGRSETFGFDPSGRLTSATLTSQYGFARTYDLAGRPVLETQSFVSGTATTYQTATSYSVDNTGHTLTQTVTYPGPSARQILRQRDGLLRLSNVADSSNQIGESWSFDGAQRRSYATRPNLVYDGYSYDPDGRIASLSRFSGPGLGGGEGWVAQDWAEYGYDPRGNKTFSRNHLATQNIGVPENRSEHYNYDNRDRLTQMDRGLLTSDNSGVQAPIIDANLANRQQWTNLDKRGNWIDFRERKNSNSVVKIRQSEANGVNEYTCIDPNAPAHSTILNPYSCSGSSSHVTPSYDVCGNMTLFQLGRNAGDTSSPSGQWFKYDEENRVIEIRKTSASGQLLLQVSYDALGRRVETTEYVDPFTGTALSSPKRTRHIYQGLETIQEYDCGAGATCSGNLLREFVWGDHARFPELIAMVDHTGAGNSTPTTCTAGNPFGGCVYHMLRDPLGSVVGLIDSNANAVERYTYDSYGKTFIEKQDLSTGTWTGTNAPSFSGNCPSAFGNPFAWTGQRYDAITGTYHFWARTYSPVLGRWLERDPLGYNGKSQNLFEYVRSSPLHDTDPLGLEPAANEWAFWWEMDDDPKCAEQKQADFKKCEEEKKKRDENATCQMDRDDSNDKLTDCYRKAADKEAACDKASKIRRANLHNRNLNLRADMRELEEEREAAERKIERAETGIQWCIWTAEGCVIVTEEIALDALGVPHPIGIGIGIVEEVLVKDVEEAG